jgi:hypothetical protein
VSHSVGPGLSGRSVQSFTPARPRAAREFFVFTTPTVDVPPGRRRAAGTAEVSSRWIFLLPRPTAAHSPEGRKIQKLLELPPIPAPAPRLRGRMTRSRQRAEARQEKTTRCRVFREDSSSSFRRSRLHPRLLRRMRSAVPAGGNGVARKEVAGRGCPCPESRRC